MIFSAGGESSPSTVIIGVGVTAIILMIFATQAMVVLVIAYKKK